jgi:hypothetical protein
VHQNNGYERTCLGNRAYDAVVNNVLASQQARVHIFSKAPRASRAPNRGRGLSTSFGGVPALCAAERISYRDPLARQPHLAADRCRRCHDRERRSAIVSRSASSSGLGLIPNAAVAAVESSTNGFRNWYWVSRAARAIGLNRPPTQSTG